MNGCHHPAVCNPHDWNDSQTNRYWDNAQARPYVDRANGSSFEETELRPAAVG
ncbi:hypothetical protein BJX64DRAFT_265115 [Aspergillus heterothallicus]